MVGKGPNPSCLPQEGDAEPRGDLPRTSGEGAGDKDLCRGLRLGAGPQRCPGSCCAGSAWGPCPPAAASAGPPRSPGRTPCAAGPGTAPSRSLTRVSAGARSCVGTPGSRVGLGGLCGAGCALWVSVDPPQRRALGQGSGCAPGVAALPAWQRARAPAEEPARPAGTLPSSGSPPGPKMAGAAAGQSFAARLGLLGTRVWGASTPSQGCFGWIFENSAS